MRNVTGISITASEAGGSQGDGFTLRASTRATTYTWTASAIRALISVTPSISKMSKCSGPAPIYFGRGSTGGIINQVSKTPVSRASTMARPAPAAARTSRHRGHQSAARPDDGSSFERHGPTRRYRRPRSCQSNPPGLRSNSQPGPWHADPDELQLLFPARKQHSGLRFSFFHGEPVRVDRGTWYGLTKDDYEKTYTNIGTISLNHQFSDALNLRSAFRYSNVRRDVEPSIPALTCVAPLPAEPVQHSPELSKPAGPPHHGRHRGQPDRSYWGSTPSASGTRSLAG